MIITFYARYWEWKANLDPDIEKDVANYVKTLKATDKAKGISKKEIEYTKAASIYRGQNYHNTVISVHDQYNQIRLSFPVAGILW